MPMYPASTSISHTGGRLSKLSGAYSSSTRSRSRYVCVRRNRRVKEPSHTPEHGAGQEIGALRGSTKVRMAETTVEVTRLRPRRNTSTWTIPLSSI